MHKVKHWREGRGGGGGGEEEEVRTHPLLENERWKLQFGERERERGRGGGKGEENNILQQLSKISKFVWFLSWQMTSSNSTLPCRKGGGRQGTLLSHFRWACVTDDVFDQYNLSAPMHVTHTHKNVIELYCFTIIIIIASIEETSEETGCKTALSTPHHHICKLISLFMESVMASNYRGWL